MSRLKKVANLDKTAKLNKRTFKETVLQNGYITIDGGNLHFIVTQINKENFPDMNQKLEEQLNDEGKYNAWVGFIDNNTYAPFSIDLLPIYGSSEKYVTDYFTYSQEEAIDQCLSDRGMKLLKRANDYIENSI